MGQPLLGDRLDISQRVEGNGIVHHLLGFFLPWVLFLSPTPLLFITIIIVVVIIIVIIIISGGGGILFQLLNRSYLSPWVLPFSNSSPHPTRRGAGE